VSVAEIRARPALPRDLEQVVGVVESIDVVARFSEQVRVPSLAARDVQHARADGKSKQLDEPRDFRASSFGCEQRAVLEKIVRVERRLPPLAALLQKNTGSRYAPKTVSIAARIS